MSGGKAKVKKPVKLAASESEENVNKDGGKTKQGGESDGCRLEVYHFGHSLILFLGWLII